VKRRKLGKRRQQLAMAQNGANGNKYQHLRITLHINTLEITSFTRANNSKEEINGIIC
jgi:hypothetical protein